MDYAFLDFGHNILQRPISLLLGLDFCPLSRVTGILQLEPHTCGVIALANLGSH